MSKIKLDVKIPISVLKEGDNFIVYTPALDLSTSAKTYKQALSRFNEAVEIFFEEILKKGTLEETLRETNNYPSAKKFADFYYQK